MKSSGNTLNYKITNFARKSISSSHDVHEIFVIFVYDVVGKENKGGKIFMKKFLVVAIMALVLTGFASTAFAGGGDSWIERNQIQAQKRLAEHEKEKAEKKKIEAKNDEKSNCSGKKD